MNGVLGWFGRTGVGWWGYRAWMLRKVVAGGIALGFTSRALCSLCVGAYTTIFSYTLFHSLYR